MAKVIDADPGPFLMSEDSSLQTSFVLDDTSVAAG